MQKPPVERPRNDITDVTRIKFIIVSQGGVLVKFTFSFRKDLVRVWKDGSNLLWKLFLLLLLLSIDNIL